MIRMVQSSSAAQAKAYFSDALVKSDYYLNDQELQGRFNGSLGERLDINGIAAKETFFALCENINPITGKPLTPRTKEERTVGYDINFHCPKSISVIHALSKDNHILQAFQESVADTMKDIEADSKTRVRKDGKYDNRDTGELLWATFDHMTSRPVKDHAPDPHLHSHCYVFNATWDEEEKKIKAGQFMDIKRDMPFYQARFHKRLSDKMVALGYQIKVTDKSFEIDGVPQKVIDMFSKRTDEIGRIAREQGITDREQLDKLGAMTRSKKQKGLSMAELKSEWRRQIKELNISQDGVDEKAIRFGSRNTIEKLQPRHCIEHAVNHSFERSSVVRDRRLLATAYKFALGHHDVSINAITNTFHQDDKIVHIKQGSQILCTTKEVLKEEQRMVDLAKKGQGTVKPLYQNLPTLKVTGEQALAVAHVLTTTNRVAIIRGAAGTGKTTLMSEAVDLIKDTGKKVIVVAPTAQASRGVLKEEGFKDAETVAKLLNDKKLQDQLQGQVLWVDEAGLLGTKDMSALLELATKKNARIILGGDTRQHSSVVRGDALRILNTVGGIQTAEVSKIYRQKNVEYRKAVKDLSEGNVKAGFDMLDSIGSIKTIDPLKPNDVLVNDYIEAIQKGKSALIVSPTHKQGDDVTDAVRIKLRKAGLIGNKEVTATKYVNLNLTEAQRGDWRNFNEGHVVQFNQNMPGIKRGSTWSVQRVDENDIKLINQHGKTVTLPQDSAKNFDVYKRDEIKLSKGDKIQITRNSFDDEDKRMNNGLALEVVSISQKGEVKVRNKASKVTYVLDKNFGHLAHAHCVTSHASQGKTVDEIFISQPASTFPATDAKQFYVSVSRGREVAHIYTDDKKSLLEYASELGERQSALELVKQFAHDDYVAHLERNHTNTFEKIVTPVHQPSIIRKSHDRSYEPGL